MGTYSKQHSLPISLHLDFTGFLKVYHWVSRHLRNSSSAQSHQSRINTPPPLARPADLDFRLDISIDQGSLGTLFENYDYLNNEDQANPHDFYGDQTDEMPQDEDDIGSDQLSLLGLNLSTFPFTNNAPSLPAPEPIPLPAIQDSSVMTSILFSPMQPGKISPSPPNYNEVTGNTSSHDQQPIQHTTVPAPPNDPLQEIFRLADSLSLALSACPSDVSSLFKLPLVALTIRGPISSADCLTILSRCTQLTELDVTIDRVEQWHGQEEVNPAALRTLSLTIQSNGLTESLLRHIRISDLSQQTVNLKLIWGAIVNDQERTKIYTRSTRQGFIVHTDF
ncbi:hypothetical protein CVT24_007447 [Panaeolus cyanescens]|uniref:Uncharacterized protein n=1 Tax=Panaeolus cyanescens TaxID=181874 RepID=A0A409W501_9AGAR|nr:hypothetical protein CVT24_007447 [Panaeolus cyanescens]